MRARGRCGPPRSSVAGPVDVTNVEGGTTTGLAAAFTYEPPIIVQVSTASDALFGGAPITVTGTSFSPTTVIHIGGKPLGSAVLSGNTISGVVPASSVAGAAPITAEDGTVSTTFAIPFTYAQAPRILQVSLATDILSLYELRFYFSPWQESVVRDP